MNINKNKLFIIVLFFLLLMSIFISFTLGRYTIDLKDIINLFKYKFLGKSYYNKTIETIILNIRMPRIIAAVFIGASLAVSGSIYQGVFNNPLVSSDILGVSQGAALGAIISIILGLNSFLIISISFLFGIFTVFFTLIISFFYKGNKFLGLVLSGIIVSSVFTSLIQILKLFADPQDELPSIIYWLMGSLNSIKNTDLIIIIPTLSISLFIVNGFSWHLNLFSLGIKEEFGFNKKLILLIFIVFATIMSSISVSFCGIIGWISILIPHFSRMIVGENYKNSIIVSMFLGGIYLLIVDNLSRILLKTEIPLGVLTGLIGAPLFLYLIIKRNNYDKN